MRVCGEAFFLINGWMNFLSLLLAARMGRRRFHAGKSTLAAGFGALYALAVWTHESPVYRSVIALTVVCLTMSWIAFGKRFLFIAPLVLASGWLLSGLSDFAINRGLSTWQILCISGIAVLVVDKLTRRIRAGTEEHLLLTVRLHGRQTTVNAIRDTGNQLADPVTGLPVIVVPIKEAQPWLAAGTNPDDLSTLPPGGRLIRAKTAAGEKALICFRPDAVWIRFGKHVRHVEAVIAISGFLEEYALLPEALFQDF